MFIIINQKLDQIISKLLTFSKCFTFILIATFCLEMMIIFEHALRYFIIDNISGSWCLLKWTKCFDQKKTHRRWKTHCSNAFCILENHTFQRIAKFIIADFYKIDFMKGIVISVKVDEMYSIWKSASHCLLVEGWDGNGWSIFFC